MYIRSGEPTFIHFQPFPLSEGHVDRPGAGGVAEPAIQPGSTAGVLVARATASTTVAKSDIGRREQAVGSRSVEAPGIAVINGAVSTADVVRASTAVDDSGVQSRTVDERVGSVGVGNEGQLGIGSSEPVVELGVGDYICSNLGERFGGELDG